MLKNVRLVDFVILMTLLYVFYNCLKYIQEFYIWILMFIMVMELKRLFTTQTEL